MCFDRECEAPDEWGGAEKRNRESEYFLIILVLNREIPSVILSVVPLCFRASSNVSTTLDKGYIISSKLLKTILKYLHAVQVVLYKHKHTPIPYQEM